MIASTREERLEENVKRLLAPHIDSEGVSPVYRSEFLGGRPTHGRLSLGRRPAGQT